MSREMFSIPAFIAWAETQDPKTEYDWYNWDDCLGMRYVRACGVQDLFKANMALHDKGIAAELFYPEPRTIGDALDRALAAARGEGS